jgi:uncharacterized protein YkwD
LFFALFNANTQNYFIENKNFNAEKVSSLISEKINLLRIENNLDTLLTSKQLINAAELHVKYLKKTKKVQLNESRKSTATTFKRVLKSKGMFSQTAETIFAFTLPDIKKAGRNKNNVNSYNDLAEVIVQAWANDKKNKHILLNNEYFHTGVAVSYNHKNKTVYISQVFASAPFDFSDIKNNKQNAFGVKPFSKSKCGSFLSNNPNLAELLANNIVVENNNIYLYYHDLSFFKNNFKKAKDAIAVDIVFRKQFNCSSGNKLFPSEVHSGLLLKPIKKGKFFTSNQLKKSGEVYVKLGKIPQGFDSTNAEINLLVIKEGCLCQSIFFNNLDGENLSLLDLPFVMDTLSLQTKPDSLVKHLSFTVPFIRNKWEFNEEDIKPFLDSLELNRYNIKKINITAYSSIEGDSIKNVQLQVNRANSILQVIEQYNLQKIEKKIITKENWEGFYESLLGSPYENKLKGLSKPQVRAMLLTDSLGFLIEPYLEDQRKAEVLLTVESIFVDSLLPNTLQLKLEKAIKRNDIDKAKALQSLLYQYAIQGKIKEQSTYNYELTRQKENSSILNNQFVFKECFFSLSKTDSFRQNLKEEFLALYYTDPSNPYVLYNKLILELEFWAKDILKLSEPELLLKDMKRLYSTRVENWRINRLILNYHILAADYYYEKKDFAKREKELKEVRKFIFSAKLDRAQTYAMARYFIFQLRVDWAIDLMLPWIKNKNYNEDFLFIFLSIAIYDTKKVAEQEYTNLMKHALELNKERYCKLFGYPNMSIQLLKNTAIKSEYCKHCN